MGYGQTNTMLGDPNQATITTRADIDAGIAKIHSHDPAFNESDFLSDANRGFFVIQQAWTERKPEISRQVMHDGIWQQHKFQIDQYIQANKQNVLENLAVQNIRVVAAKPEPVVFILWGSSARKKAQFVDTSRHTVIESPHPSPLSAHRGFFGSRPFSRANAALESAGREPVDWSLPAS